MFYSKVPLFCATVTKIHVRQLKFYCWVPPKHSSSQGCLSGKSGHSNKISYVGTLPHKRAARFREMISTPEEGFENVQFYPNNSGGCSFSKTHILKYCCKVCNTSSAAANQRMSQEVRAASSLLPCLWLLSARARPPACLPDVHLYPTVTTSGAFSSHWMPRRVLQDTAKQMQTTSTLTAQSPQTLQDVKRVLEQLQCRGNLSKQPASGVLKIPLLHSWTAMW